MDARAKYKAEQEAELAKMKAKKIKEKPKANLPEQKPDSTIMRIVNKAQEDILNVEQMILAKQAQAP